MRVIFMRVSQAWSVETGSGEIADQVADVVGRWWRQFDAEAALQCVGNELEAGAVANDLEGLQIEQGR